MEIEQTLKISINIADCKIDTIIGKLVLGQLQIQCKECGHKMFITRLLLSICKYQKMSVTTEKNACIAVEFNDVQSFGKNTGYVQHLPG